MIKLRTPGEVNAYCKGQSEGRDQAIIFVVETLLLWLYEVCEWTPEQIRMAADAMVEAVEAWAKDPEDVEEHYNRMLDETGLEINFHKKIILEEKKNVK